MLQVSSENTAATACMSCKLLPLTVLLTYLSSHEAGLKFSIAIPYLVTHFRCRLQKIFANFVGESVFGNTLGSSSAVVTTFNIFRINVILGLDEVGQHMSVSPAFVPQGLPAVKIPPVTTDVQHVVDGP